MDSCSSDISEKWAWTDIIIINSYVGRFTDSAGGDATLAQTQYSIVNPNRYGTRYVFLDYQNNISYSFLIPVLIQLDNCTYVADLSMISEASTAGCETKFDYSLSGTVSVIAFVYNYGVFYLIGEDGGTPVTVYQGGSERYKCVMGAYCGYHSGC